MDQKKIDAMRAGGKIMAKIFAELKEYTQPGMTGTVGRIILFAEKRS